MRLETAARSIACAGIFFLCAAAQAQQVGTYEGTTSDGQPLSLAVGYDPTLGQYYLSWFGTSITLKCPISGQQWHGLGLSGAKIATIEGDQATVLYSNSGFYLESTMTFTNATSVQGKVRGAFPQFLPDQFPPRRAESCQSLNLPFTATWVSPQAAPSPTTPANTVTTSVARSSGTLQLVLPAASR